jgi:hypothetical protein
MRSVRPALVAGIAVVATALPLPEPLDVPFAARPVAAADACVDGWQSMTVPAKASPNSLFKTVARAGRPAWLLGGSHTAGDLAFRWDGGAWVDTPVPSAGTRGLTGGIPTSGTALTAVGYVGAGERVVAGRVTGRSWKPSRVGAPRGGASTFSDAAKSHGSVWAVGARADGGRVRAFAMRLRSGRWDRRDPSVGGGESGLTAVAATPSGAVWAAGWRSAPDGWLRPVIVRHGGKGWKVVPVSLPAGNAVLTDVHFATGRTGWAVGYLVQRGESRHQPVLLAWDGQRWEREPLPWADDRSIVLRGVSLDRRGVLWLAGTRLANADREVRGFVAQRRPADWVVHDLDVPADLPSELRSIAGVENGAFAAGSVGATSVAIMTCGPGIGSAGRRVAIDGMRARRRARVATDDEGAERGQGAIAAVPSAVTPAGLSDPVAPRGFRIRDVATDVGLAETTKTWSGVVADLDDDRWDDLFYSRHYGRKPRLLLGGANGFTNGSTDAFLVGDRHGCAAADVDGDEANDIYCALGRARGTSVGRNELVLRAGAGATEARAALGASDPFGRGRRVAFLRLDGDRFPELFVSTTPRRVDGLPVTNRFFRNDGGRFIPAPQVGLDRSVGGLAVEVADLDGDGDDDLLTSETHPRDGRAPGLRFYRNEDGQLRERSRARGISPMGDVDVLVAELTGDQRPDLVQLSATRLRVSRQTAGGFKRIFQASLTDGVALAAGDVDGDGRVDLYLQRGGKGNKPDRLLVNARAGRAWRSVRIPQAKGGDADDVLAIDHDRNGLTDFVVLNGLEKAGPVQLLASFPEP